MDAQAGLQLFLMLFGGAVVIVVGFAIAGALVAFSLANRVTNRGLRVVEQVAAPGAEWLAAQAKRAEQRAAPGGTNLARWAQQLGVSTATLQTWISEGRVQLSDGPA